MVPTEVKRPCLRYCLDCPLFRRFAAHDTSQLRRPHQSGYRAAATPKPSRRSCRQTLRTDSVDLVVFIPEAADLRQKVRVPPRPSAGPGRITGRGLRQASLLPYLNPFAFNTTRILSL